MNWQHLIDTARMLADVSGTAPPPGGPRQAMLRRAVSTAYYAMFHALCQSNADTLVGASPAGNDIQIWLQTYRALGHRPARERLASYRSVSPPAIRNFANLFGNLQEQRHDADYNPRKAFVSSEVTSLIDRAEATTTAFCNTPEPQRRILAICLLLQRNRN